MKSTGIVRKIDSLGRFVLPIEMRNTMDIQTGDSIEIFVDDDKVVLKKYMPACLFCGNAENVIYFRGKLVCKDCFTAMKNAIDVQ